MKKIYTGLYGFLLIILSGCILDNEQLLDKGESVREVKVSFLVNIPSFAIQTRQSLINENTLTNMYVLVFDENGNFLERVQASVIPSSTAGGTFTATLHASTAKRIIHFIANYNWAGFDDAAAYQRDEREIVAALKGGDLYMWARVVLNSGISSTSFTGQTINLVRNMAKVTVQQTAASETANFTGGTFAVRYMPSMGTVAPFDPSTYTFPDPAEGLHVITEPAGMECIGNGSFKSFGTDISNAEYVFERKNSLVTENNYTCVILHGTYNDNGIQKESYYKIDLIDSQKKRYDIERNYWYKLTINKILRAGYATEQQALNNAAANNISIDVTIEKYPAITDGMAKIEVEKTLIVFTENRSVLNTWAHYYPNIQTNPTVIDNSGVTVSLIEEDPQNPLVKDGFNWDPATGKIMANINNIPGDNSQRHARIMVTKDELSRSIRLILRPAYSFAPLSINETDPGIVSAVQGESAVLRFTIPEDFPDDYMPLSVKIYTQGLYPGLTPGGESQNLQLVVDNSQIQYIYTASTKGPQVIYLKTNLSSNKEVVRLEADLFSEGRVGYNVNYINGDIVYLDDANGNAAIAVPYAERANLKAQQGYIYLLDDGKYRWSYPITFSATTTDHIFFSKKVSSTSKKIYSADVSRNSLANATPPNKITLQHTHSAISGSITYGLTTPYSSVPKGETVTATVGSITVTADGTYEYTYPITGVNESTSVTLRYEAHLSGNVHEIYTVNVPFSTLKSGGTVNLNTRSQIIIWGNIYRSSVQNLVPKGQGSTNYGTFEVYQDGKYKLILQGDTPESQSIRFSYNFRNKTLTLAQLRIDSTVVF